MSFTQIITNITFTVTLHMCRLSASLAEQPPGLFLLLPCYRTIITSDRDVCLNCLHDLHVHRQSTLGMKTLHQDGNKNTCNLFASCFFFACNCPMSICLCSILLIA